MVLQLTPPPKSTARPQRYSEAEMNRMMIAKAGAQLLGGVLGGVAQTSLEEGGALYGAITPEATLRDQAAARRVGLQQVRAQTEQARATADYQRQRPAIEKEATAATLAGRGIAAGATVFAAKLGADSRTAVKRMDVLHKAWKRTMAGKLGGSKARLKLIRQYEKAENEAQKNYTTLVNAKMSSPRALAMALHAWISRGDRLRDLQKRPRMSDDPAIQKLVNSFKGSGYDMGDFVSQVPPGGEAESRMDVAGRKTILLEEASKLRKMKTVNLLFQQGYANDAKQKQEALSENRLYLENITSRIETLNAAIDDIMTDPARKKGYEADVGALREIQRSLMGERERINTTEVRTPDFQSPEEGTQPAPPDQTRAPTPTTPTAAAPAAAPPTAATAANVTVTSVPGKPGVVLVGGIPDPSGGTQPDGEASKEEVRDIIAELRAKQRKGTLGPKGRALLSGLEANEHKLSLDVSE